MAGPTRSDITATVALPTYQVFIYNGSSWTQYTGANIISVQGQIESGSGANGLSFGDQVIASATIVFPDTVSIPTAWQMQRVRIEMTYNNKDFVPMFYGFIEAKERNGRDITLRVVGIDKRIERTKLFSNVRYRRPVATKVTAVTDENPDSGAYTGGAINEIFWRAGGRPATQSGSYPTAEFFYNCDQSLITPEWTWFSGDNLLDELYSLARAGGGQIYQGSTNVIQYVQPFSFNSGSSTAVLTDASYSELNESQTTSEQVGTIRAIYTPRILKGMQVIYDDNNAKLIAPNNSITIEARTQLPIYEYATVTPSGAFKAVDWNADPITPSISGAVTTSSQRMVIGLSNNLPVPFVITKIELLGKPVSATEKGYTSYGSGEPERQLEDNPYIQSKQHADMLCRMVYDFYSPIKPIISVTTFPDPDRYVGETVTLVSNYYTISGLYRIIGVTHDLGAVDTTMRMVSVSGLYKRSDMFIVGTSYSAGDTRRVSY